MDYYDKPTDKIFDEVKRHSIALWLSYDDSYGYATKKVNSIKDLKNISDNVMSIVSRFDINNQIKLAGLLSDNSNQAIRERMIAGGSDKELIVF